MTDRLGKREAIGTVTKGRTMVLTPTGQRRYIASVLGRLTSRNVAHSAGSHVAGRLDFAVASLRVTLGRIPGAARAWSGETRW